MNSLRIECISKKFEIKVILDNVSCEFKKGFTYLIKGESGTGKTTLLNILAGYIKPDSGTIHYNSNLVCGYLFQDEMLFSNLTVKENLYIKYCSLTTEDKSFDLLVSQILGRFGVMDLIDRKIAMLSGGERQRVQLASILLTDPNVVLIDEPTSKLDEKNKKKIIEVITEVFKSKILIIISHDNNEFGSNCVKINLENGVLSYE